MNPRLTGDVKPGRNEATNIERSLNCIQTCERLFNETGGCAAAKCDQHAIVAIVEASPQPLTNLSELRP
jgi:hypothetical protein